MIHLLSQFVTSLPNLLTQPTFLHAGGSSPEDPPSSTQAVSQPIGGPGATSSRRGPQPSIHENEESRVQASSGSIPTSFQASSLGESVQSAGDLVPKTRPSTDTTPASAHPQGGDHLQPHPISQGLLAPSRQSRPTPPRADVTVKTGRKGGRFAKYITSQSEPNLTQVHGNIDGRSPPRAWVEPPLLSPGQNPAPQSLLESGSGVLESLRSSRRSSDVSPRDHGPASADEYSPHRLGGDLLSSAHGSVVTTREGRPAKVDAAASHVKVDEQGLSGSRQSNAEDRASTPIKSSTTLTTGVEEPERHNGADKQSSAQKTAVESRKSPPLMSQIPPPPPMPAPPVMDAPLRISRKPQQVHESSVSSVDIGSILQSSLTRMDASWDPTPGDDGESSKAGASTVRSGWTSDAHEETTSASTPQITPVNPYRGILRPRGARASRGRAPQASRNPKGEGPTLRPEGVPSRPLLRAPQAPRFPTSSERSARSPQSSQGILRAPSNPQNSTASNRSSLTLMDELNARVLSRRESSSSSSSSASTRTTPKVTGP